MTSASYFCATSTNVDERACGNSILRYLVLATSLINLLFPAAWVLHHKGLFTTEEKLSLQRETNEKMKKVRVVTRIISVVSVLIKFVGYGLIFLGIGVAQNENEYMISEIYIALFLASIVLSIQYLTFGLLLLCKPFFQNDQNHFLLRADMLFVKIWVVTTLILFLGLTVVNIVMLDLKAFIIVRMVRFSLLSVFFLIQAYLIHSLLKIIKKCYNQIQFDNRSNSSLKIKYERILKMTEFCISLVVSNAIALIITFVVLDVFLEKSIVYQIIKIPLDWMASIGILTNQDQKGDSEIPSSNKNSTIPETAKWSIMEATQKDDRVKSLTTSSS